jgi:hypothetical protein
MPTFNKDLTSLTSDLTGLGAFGVHSETYSHMVSDPVNGSAPTSTLTTPTSTTINLDGSHDQLVAGDEAEDTANYKDGVQEIETHTAKETLSATVITMSEWKTSGSKPGSYWVMGEDGWAYWAQALTPDTSTGLLLDSISLTGQIDQEWYYAIEPVSEFATLSEIDLLKADSDADGVALINTITAPTVTSMSVYAGSATPVTDVTLNAGDTLQFTTLIYGENFPSQDVTYTLTDPKGSATGTIVAQDAATTIDPATGKLTIGKDELNTGFSVKVTSVEDPTFTQSITVNVTMPFMSFDYDMTKASSDVLFGATSLDVTLLIGAGDNNYMVDWGDGATTTNHPSHTYATAATRTITVSGRLPGGITFDTYKYSAAHHGEQRLVKFNTALLRQDSPDMRYIFRGCANLTSIPEDLFVKNTQATNFIQAFQNCTSLTTIPANLFVNNTQATTFDHAFLGCTALTSIPDNLFANNTQVTSFTYAFYGCAAIITIPDTLFANNTKVTSFAYIFQGCAAITTIPDNLFANNTQVTDFGHVFHGCTSLTTIPGNIFANNTQVTNFTYAFQNCTGLTTVPASLFANNTQVTDFSHVFRGCTNLATIPGNIFANNIQVTDFIDAFYNCTSLISIPANLFDNNTQVTNFNLAFSGCTGIGSATDLPDWWNDAKYPVATYPQFHLTAVDAVRMFGGCTNARNYSSVPTTPLVWK